MRNFILAILLITISFASVTVQSTNESAPKKFDGVLKVMKTAPSDVSLYEEFNVNIEISNIGTEVVSATVEESLGNVEPISPEPIYSEPGNYYAAQPPKLVWQIELAPGATQTISYRVKSLTVGEISIGPTAVYVNGGKFFSNSIFVNVGCTTSGTCDSKIGETPLTCPEKCGGDASIVPIAPKQEIIPTPAIDGPVKNPESVITDEDRAQLQEYNDKMNMGYLIIGAIIVIVIVGTYFLFLRKK